MFTRFKKQYNLRKSEQELQQEFEKEKRAFAQFVGTQTYVFLKEYLEAKIEINRDKIELLDPLQQGAKIIALQAQNEFMRDFINDVEGMKTLSEIEVSQRELN